MDKRSLWALYQMDVSNKFKASGKHPTRLELSVSHLFPIWRVHDMKLKVAVVQEGFFFLLSLLLPPPPYLENVKKTVFQPDPTLQVRVMTAWCRPDL